MRAKPALWLDRGWLTPFAVGGIIYDNSIDLGKLKKLLFLFGGGKP
jgi:hypothetical protein